MTTWEQFSHKLQQIQEAKKGDGNLANNYPPYDKVTRGDVIAGALNQDQKGGKKKVQEELKGNQSKIDANHNGKIDGDDFAILRRTKKKILK